MIKGVLFDLDGVITDTAEYHYQAWQKISDKYGFYFNRAMNEKLKGVSREASLEIILDANQTDLSEEQFQLVLEEKNQVYVNLLESIDKSDLLPGIDLFLKQLKDQNIKMAIASASKNAEKVLSMLGLSDFFDYVVDVSKVKNTKPHPEIFLVAQKALLLEKNEVIGIEDSQAGIDALNTANIFSVGIGSDLKGCNILLEDTAKLDFESLKTKF